MSEMQEFLMQHFGFSDFRGRQLDIVTGVLEGRDVVAILATGSGKSLTYQFPALWSNRSLLTPSSHSVGRKVSLVISPLLSLMQDQVMSLANTSVRACFFNSNTQNRAAAIAEIAAGAHDLVYTSPESLYHVMPALLQLHALGRVALVAVDEAHCVSEWGHDFRPEYRKLDCVRAQLPGVPIIALTATATAAVQADIAKSLRLQSPMHMRASFNRSELQYHVKQKQSIANDIGSCIAACSGSVVVYALTRDDVESICAALNGMPAVSLHANGNTFREFAAFYHAGISQERRTKVHEDFLLDRVRVVVATVAFGMGIDKKNVRAVVHWGMPKSMEEYYQQTGRGGRDGDVCVCTMFYSAGDFRTGSNLINSNLNQAAKSMQMDQLLRMKEFCMSTACRRAAILNYFGEAQPVQCTGCDVCDAAASADASNTEIHDFTADFRIVLELVMANKKNLTVNQIIAVLRGTKEGQKHCSGVGFGSGGSHNNKWWENVCHVMVSSQLLKMELVSYLNPQGRSVSYTVVCSTPAAAAFVRDSQQSPAPLPIALVPLPQSLRTRPQLHPSASLSTASTANDQFFDTVSARDQELFVALNAKRVQLAKDENCSLTSIAFDSVLRGITLHKPSTLHQLASCRLLGNSEQKLQKYGQLWCNIVMEFCGGDSFSPPARHLPQSMGGALSAINCSEFDLPLDKKGDELYGGLKAIRAQIACETTTAAGDVALDRFLRFIAHHKPSTVHELEICVAEMKRKGFAGEIKLQHAQRWLEVVAAVCGTDSFTDPTASAPCREPIPKRAFTSGAETQAGIVGNRATFTIQSQDARDGAQVQEVVGGRCEAQPLLNEGTDLVVALRVLLLKQQPSMIDRLGKNIGASVFSSFVEVVTNRCDITSFSAERNIKLSTVQGYILECIAGGCVIHLDPSHYSFDVASAISAIQKSRPSNEQHAVSTARAHALMAYSCILTHIINAIAVDVSETEMASCLDATQSAVSQECGRELPLSFLTKCFAASAVPHDAASLNDLNEADMQFIHEWACSAKMKPIMELIDVKVVPKDRQGDCYKCIQFALCACAGLAFFVDRFSTCLGLLFGSIGGAKSSTAAPQPAVALSKLANSPAIKGEEHSFEATNPPSQITAPLPVVSSASANVTTGSLTSSTSSLPSEVLLRIEANKQAALQRRKAAEDAANLQRQDESATRASLQARGHDSARPPAGDQQPPSVAQSDTSEPRRSVKRHWGVLGAVPDDEDD